jgi:hypothetical protein
VDAAGVTAPPRLDGARSLRAALAALERHEAALAPLVGAGAAVAPLVGDPLERLTVLPPGDAALAATLARLAGTPAAPAYEAAARLHARSRPSHLTMLPPGDAALAAALARLAGRPVAPTHEASARRRALPGPTTSAPLPGRAPTEAPTPGATAAARSAAAAGAPRGPRPARAVGDSRPAVRVRGADGAAASAGIGEGANGAPALGPLVRQVPGGSAAVKTPLPSAGGAVAPAALADAVADSTPGALARTWRPREGGVPPARLAAGPAAAAPERAEAAAAAERPGAPDSAAPGASGAAGAPAGSPASPVWEEPGRAFAPGPPPTAAGLSAGPAATQPGRGALPAAQASVAPGGSEGPRAQAAGESPLAALVRRFEAAAEPASDAASEEAVDPYDPARFAQALERVLLGEARRHGIDVEEG